MGAVAGMVMGGAQVFGTFQEAVAIKNRAAFEAERGEMNAMLSDFAAKDALERGDRQAAEIGRQAKQVKGQQRVILAAQGIDIDSGTAAQLQEDVEYFSSLDAATVKSNAWREAFGLKTQSQESRLQSRMAKFAGDSKEKQTLLTGAFKAGSSVVGGFAGS